jgi:hypothetical protein
MTQIDHEAAGVQPLPTRQAPQAPGRRRTGVVAAGVVAVAVVSGTAGFTLGRATAAGGDAVGAVAAEADGDLRLVAAADACERRDADGTMSLVDDGWSIVIDTRSEYGSTAGLHCVLRELGTPQSIEAQVGRTTAMMGVQDAEDDGLEYSWSYHPDDGVSMVITATD